MLDSPIQRQGVLPGGRPKAPFCIHGDDLLDGPSTLTGHRPEQYQWSSFTHYATGIPGVVEIESEWTARTRGPLIAIKLR